MVDLDKALADFEMAITDLVSNFPNRHNPAGAKIAANVFDQAAADIDQARAFIALNKSKARELAEIKESADYAECFSKEKSEAENSLMESAFSLAKSSLALKLEKFKAFYSHWLITYNLAEINQQAKCN